MKRFRLPAFCVFLLFGLIHVVVAQDFEREAIDILKLYEEGRTDTAYDLIEPLKRNARFVPAALYVRAQMTEDDRALNLYREIIALEPNGAWADEAAYQLVMRYVTKKDSLAAWTWYGMLEKSYPQSPYIAKASTSLKETKSWTFITQQDQAVPNRPHSGNASASSPGGASTPPSTNTTTRTDTPVALTTRKTYYGLQVGLLPTRSAAQRHIEGLKSSGLSMSIYEKDVSGRKSFAVVVGPYDSQEAAAAKKSEVAKTCECDAFTVIVE
jgi:hypothetical protein